MNVYDFDKTIYPADSTASFYGFCLRHYPRTWLTLPCTVWAFFALGTHLLPKTRAKELFFRFLRHTPPEAPDRFWAAHRDRFCPWYLAQRRPEDLIIYASPAFLIATAAAYLGISFLASPVDRRTGRYSGRNCDGAEKLRRYRAVWGDTPVEGFWSDSRSDHHMAEFAEKAWLVRRGIPEPW